MIDSCGEISPLATICGLSQPATHAGHLFLVFLEGWEGQLGTGAQHPPLATTPDMIESCAQASTAYTIHAGQARVT